MIDSNSLILKHAIPQTGNANTSAKMDAEAPTPECPRVPCTWELLTYSYPLMYFLAEPQTTISKPSGRR